MSNVESETLFFTQNQKILAHLEFDGRATFKKHLKLCVIVFIMFQANFCLLLLMTVCLRVYLLLK